VLEPKEGLRLGSKSHCMAMEFAIVECPSYSVAVQVLSIYLYHFIVLCFSFLTPLLFILFLVFNILAGKR
jgi:hypothetical protein